MIIYKKFKDYKNYIRQLRISGKKIGFVPTMGALHDGHLAIIKQCRQLADITVSSIFVNPTQFNNTSDFNKYPVTLDQDVYQLEMNGCDILLIPDKEEVYPDSYHYTEVDLGKLEHILEGAYRPGHFQGVCQVVQRLLEVVQPNLLIMGQKDFQQLMVIKKLLSLLNSNIQLIISPTIREYSGLALSSRNARLSSEQKERATAIYKSLIYIQQHYKTIDWSELKKTCHQMLAAARFIVDYIEIAAIDSLDIKNVYDPNENCIALIAATIDEVRLIDNMVLNN